MQKADTSSTFVLEYLKRKIPFRINFKTKKMKKLLLVMAIATVGMVSCSREHTCDCKSMDSSGNPTSTKTSITATKKSAIEKCDEGDKDPIIGQSTDCEITSL